MDSSYRINADLMKELEQMRLKVRQVEECRMEFLNIQKKYEKLPDSAPDALVFVSADNIIVEVNAQFENLFGYSHGEIIGRELEVVIPDRFKGQHRANVSSFFNDPRVRPMGSGIEIYAKKKDGEEFPADISLSPLQTDSEMLVTAAIRDITKHRQADEQIKPNFIIQSVLNSMLKISLEPLSLETQFDRILDLILSVPHLAQAEKLAALGRFTANVAHEIRNPLTAIGGFARWLDKVISEQTKEKEYASFIISEVARLEIILKNVLTFSRDVSPQLEEYDIHEIIDRVLKMKEEICREKSISIHKSYSDLPSILIDNVQLHEAVENLVLNAIDSMPRGGSLTVTTNREVHDGIPYVYVSIHDSGKGIPEEKLNMIFEPFYTTKVAEKGTGLGLSITKKVVEDHGGFMKVESEVGKGSAFTLYFPYKLDL